jgi:diadenosine tetraphosphate (Ap4A) HIT family hydrolase
VVVAARRHVRCLDELAEEEAVEYITLLRAIRRAQRQVLGVEQVYYFLNEDTPHHLHGWMVPRYPWMQAFGSSVESLRPALMHAQRTFATEQGEAAVVEAVARLRAALTWPDPSRSS